MFTPRWTLRQVKAKFTGVREVSLPIASRFRFHFPFRNLAVVLAHDRLASTLSEFDRRNHLMNYPLLPADSAAYAWQLACCGFTLFFALISFVIGPR